MTLAEVKAEATRRGIPESEQTPEALKVIGWTPDVSLFPEGWNPGPVHTTQQVMDIRAMVAEEAKANAEGGDIMKHVDLALNLVMKVVGIPK